MEAELSKEEKELLEKVLKKHREIMAKTGYGKILVHYDKKNDKQFLEVTGQVYTRSVIKFG